MVFKFGVRISGVVFGESTTTEKEIRAGWVFFQQLNSFTCGGNMDFQP